MVEPNVMNVVIAPLAEPHFEQLRAVLDVVARERLYLAALEAAPPERSFAFYRSLLADGQGHVALGDGRVVGWCDIQPSFGQARAHVGVLGMGLLPNARRHGIGTAAGGRHRYRVVTRPDAHRTHGARRQRGCAGTVRALRL